MLSPKTDLHPFFLDVIFFVSLPEAEVNCTKVKLMASRSGQVC